MEHRIILLLCPLFFNLLWQFSEKVALILLRIIIEQRRRILTQLTRCQNHAKEQILVRGSYPEKTTIKSLKCASYGILDYHMRGGTRRKKLNACVLLGIGVNSLHMFLVGRVWVRLRCKIVTR